MVWPEADATLVDSIAANQVPFAIFVNWMILARPVDLGNSGYFVPVSSTWITESSGCRWVPCRHAFCTSNLPLD